jgi:transketolase
MRETFWNEMVDIMAERPDVTVLMLDTGFQVMDEVREKYGGERCFNAGIAECNGVGVAAGMAMSGLTPVCYAIAPFVTSRPFEMVRDDVCIQGLNVKLVGVGAGVDYNSLGSTHHADCDIAIMRALPNMTIYSPCDQASTRRLAREMFEKPGPAYFRMSRYAEAQLYGANDGTIEDLGGFTFARRTKWNNSVILATGKMVGTALEVAEREMDIDVIDVFRLKPLDMRALAGVLKDYDCIDTVEEHSIVGGLGSIIAEVIAEYSGEVNTDFRRHAMPDAFIREYGSHEYLQMHPETREWVEGELRV